MAKKLYPIQKEIRKRLVYDYTSGEFTWINGPREGMKAGTNTRDGVQIRMNKQGYKAHILAWIYAYGEFPAMDIDHKDRNWQNNRLDNLRLATKSQNQVNTRRNNKFGYKGIQKSGNKWAAKIRIGKTKVHLGVFDTKEQAHEAFMSKSRELHGEFASDGKRTNE